METKSLKILLIYNSVLCQHLLFFKLALFNNMCSSLSVNDQSGNENPADG